MKGLDGLQGPIYVGTGCVFRRQALYGYDAPAKKKPPSKTCNCWPNWCCLCCGTRKKNGGKSKKDKSKKLKQRDTSKQIHALETIEEGIEGTINCHSKEHGTIRLIACLLVLLLLGPYNDLSIFMTEPNIVNPPPISQEKLEKKFGQSPVFVVSTLLEDGGTLKGVSSTSLLKEAIHVISCGYEDKTEWGKEVTSLVSLSLFTTTCN